MVPPLQQIERLELVEFSILQRSGGRQTHVHQRWRGPRALPRAAQGLYPRLLRPAVCRGRHCAFGPPEVCAARIQGFLDAGAKTVMLGPTWPDVEQVRRIAHDVVPRLQ